MSFIAPLAANLTNVKELQALPCHLQEESTFSQSQQLLVDGGRLAGCQSDSTVVCV